MLAVSAANDLGALAIYQNGSLIFSTGNTSSVLNSCTVLTVETIVNCSVNDVFSAYVYVNSDFGTRTYSSGSMSLIAC